MTRTRFETLCVGPPRPVAGDRPAVPAQHRPRAGADRQVVIKGGVTRIPMVRKLVAATSSASCRAPSTRRGDRARAALQAAYLATSRDPPPPSARGSSTRPLLLGRSGYPWCWCSPALRRWNVESPRAVRVRDTASGQDHSPRRLGRDGRLHGAPGGAAAHDPDRPRGSAVRDSSARLSSSRARRFSRMSPRGRRGPPRRVHAHPLYRCGCSSAWSRALLHDVYSRPAVARLLGYDPAARSLRARRRNPRSLAPARRARAGARFRDRNRPRPTRFSLGNQA